MKTLMGLLLMITIPLTVGCGSSSRDDPRLEGTWKFTRVVNNGKEAPAELINRNTTVTFEGNTMITKRRGKVVDTWTYKVDATKNPKQMTITMGEPGKEKDYYEIYSIEGDTLTMCSGSRTFPEEFNTRLEPGAYFSVRTRVKE